MEALSCGTFLRHWQLADFKTRIRPGLCAYPPPPVPKNHLAQEPTPGSAVKFSHHFFYQGSGFFMFLVDVGQLFRCAGHHFMCVTMGPPIRGDPISHSQAHVCFCTTSSIPCSVPQTFPCTLPVSLSSIGSKGECSTEAWPQGAAQTGIQDGVSQEEGFHVSAS